MPRGNPNPKISTETQFAAVDDFQGELSKKAIAIRLPVEVDAYLRSLDVAERTALLRTAIIEAVKAHWDQTNSDSSNDQGDSES